MLKKAASGLFIVLLATALPLPASSSDNVAYNLPWEKFSFRAGYFFAGMNDQVTVGAGGAGIQLDAEDLLGLKSQTESIRLGASYRIGEARRHRVDVEWFYFNRSADVTLGQDIVVDNTTIPTGTPVSTTFNIQYIKAVYRYSFFMDDRMDLSGAIGLFVMPLKFEIAASGIISESAKLKFTAPLPTLGLHGDFAVTRRLFIRTAIDFFYYEYQGFTGSLIDSNISVEYNPWKNFGFGVGWENFKMGLRSDGNDYPNVDFQGDIKSQFMGIEIYARYFF